MNAPPSSTLDRSRPPGAGAVRPFGFPSVASSTLPNGLGLRVATMSQLPLVTVSVVLPAGESLLQDHQAGLAVLAGMAMEGGTARRSGFELAEALEGIGTGLSVHTGWDATTVSLTCLAERMGEAMELLAEALLQPSLPEEEVARLRSQRLAGIRQRRMDPGSLANDAANHFFFSDRVPYHRPLAGTPESVEPIDPGVIREFVDAHYRPVGAGLVVVGDVEIGEVEALSLRWFGAWKGERAQEADFAEEPRFRESRVLIVDRPGAVQSEIRIGQPGAPRSTPLFFPLKIFNTVLGGAFTSRLMLNLREKHGFTYGARSRFSLRRRTGPFMVSTAVGTEVTAPAVREALREVGGLVEGGPSVQEVEQARDFLAGVFPLALETTGQVAARISELLVYALPDDYFGTYRDRIREVDAPAAGAAGREVVRPGELVTVVVGDAEAVRGPLEELGLGIPEVVTPF